MTDAQTSLLLHCGDVESREANDAQLKPPARPDWKALDSLPIDQWIKGLIPLVEAAAVWKCKRCDGTGEHSVGNSKGGCPCPDCMGTGKVTDPHALLRMCLAVAWKAQRVWMFTQNRKMKYEIRKVNRVLRACQAYLDDPTDERQKVWDVACGECDDEDVAQWLPVPYVTRKLLTEDLMGAAKVFVPERFRAVVLEAVSG